MKKNPFSFFYNKEQEALPELLLQAPNLNCVTSLEQLTEQLKFSEIVFIQTSGKLLQEIIKLILRNKKDFVIVKPDNNDLILAQEVMKTFRKNKTQSCWLSSLRFFQAAAKLRELINSNCLGIIQEIHCSVSSDCQWNNLQIDDLLKWLCPDETNVDYAKNQECENDLEICVKASLGNAKIALNQNNCQVFRKKIADNTEKKYILHNDYKNTEINMLFFLHKNKIGWKTIMPQIRE